MLFLHVLISLKWEKCTQTSCCLNISFYEVFVFLQIFSIGMFYSQKRACRVSAEGERNLLTRPMRLPPHCKSPILQHCPPSMSLTVCCPRILQAIDYSIGPEVGEAHPPECRTMLC